LRDDVDLVLAAGVGDVGDPLAVGRPDRRAVVDAGGAGQVADGALLGRDGEDVAAGVEHGALAVGTDVEIVDVLLDVGEPAPGDGAVGGHADGHLGRLLRGQVEPVDPAAVLEHDGGVAERRELDIERVIVGELAGLLGAPLVDIQVHAAVGSAVGQEVDPVAVPHGDDVLGRVVGDVLGLLRREVVDPDVVGLAAAVALPGAELAEHAVVGELLAVGGIGAEAAARQGELPRQVAVRAHQVELSLEVVELPHAGAEDDLTAGGRPAHHDVVGTHAVGDVVAAQRRRPGQALGDAPLGGNQIDLGVAVVLAGERQVLAVG